MIIMNLEEAGLTDVRLLPGFACHGLKAVDIMSEVRLLRGFTG
jgi:hypothetical protein